MAIWDNVREAVKSGKYADDELNFQIVQIRTPGTIVMIDDIPGQGTTFFWITKIRLEVDETGIYRLLDLLPVTDEGDDLGDPIITVNEDMYDIKCM